MSFFGVSGRFLPGDIGINSIWDADNVNGDGTTPANNSAISSWADLGANGNTVSQPTGSAQPTYVQSVVNGRNVVRFPGTQWLSRANGAENSYSGSLTVIGIASTSTTSASGRLMAKNISYAAGRSGSAYAFTTRTIQDYISTGSQFVSNQFQVFSQVFNVGNGVSFYRNDNFIIVVAGTGINAGTGTLTIGTLTGAGEFWSGDMNAVYLAFRALARWELNLINLYGKTKIGIV